MSHTRMFVRLAALALVTALPVSALAQTARVEGMALQGDYIKDYTNIWTYLSGVPTVGNLVYGELGAVDGFSTSPRDQAMGAVLGNLFEGRLGTWAIHLHQQTPNLGQGDATSGPNPQDSTGINQDPNTNLNQSFDIMWGKKFGTMNLGLRFNRAFRKSEDVAGGVTTDLEFDDAGATNNLGRNIVGFSGGVGFEMSQNSNLEVAAGFANRSFENSVTPPGTFTKDDGGTTYQVAGRLMWQWTPSTVITPVVKFYSFDLSTATSAPAKFDNKLSGWQIGAAGNWTVGTSDLLVLGATFAQNTLDQEQDVFGLAVPAGFDPNSKITETLAPQVFAALETHVNRWLTLRFGANQGAYSHLKFENQGTAPAHTLEITHSAFHMNLGAGVKVGTLQLDAVLANNFAQTLGWVGSGIANTYFPKVTATYAF